MISAKTLPFIVPKNPFGHSKRRLPERKYMTLVAGFSGRGGLVLFADSQETKQGYAKRSVDKLEMWQSRGDLSVVTGGAGNADHLDKLTTQIGNATMSCPNSDVAGLVDTIERIVTKFFTDHIWSRSVDRPEVELLLAIHSKPGFLEQFHIADGLVNHIPGSFKSIGVGSYLADFLLGKLGEGGQEESEMMAVATYILKEVKSKIDGCGLNSMIWLLRQTVLRSYLNSKMCPNWKPSLKDMTI